MLKFDCEDNGNCRVYYRDGRALYCYQDEGRQGWKYYSCSRDGEPSHEVKWPTFAPLTPGETTVGRDLNLILATSRVDGIGQHRG